MKKIILSLITIHLSIFTLYAQSWSSVDPGISIFSVNTITVCNNELCAACADGHGAYYISGFNNSSWNSYNANLTAIGNVAINMLYSYNNNLMVGGLFTYAGTPATKVNNIAILNDTTWTPLSRGLTGPGFSNQVGTFTTYNNNLVVGGIFDSAGNIHSPSIAMWNGSAWDSLGGGFSGYPNIINALCVYNGNLYAAGSFLIAGGTLANNIAMWNGTTWDSLGSGINGSNVYVTSLCVYNGNLYAGGAFTKAGGAPANNIAMWNGTSWSAVGTGVDTMGAVYALTVYNGSLCVAGQFTNAGGNPANNIALWNGTAWSAMGSGTNNIVWGLTVYNGALFAGGEFDTAGGLATNHIARWGTTPAGINDIQNNTQDINVYPNPTNGVLTVVIKNYELGITNQVEVYNMLGEKVHSQFTINNSQFTIDLSNNPSGVYLYKVTAQDGNIIGQGKVVIQK